MANYGYASRGYTTSDDMDHPRYGGGYTYSDHVCRPVIIDANGRKQPIISYTPNESYVVKKETIIERVHSPISEYKNYGAHNDKWRRPSSPIRDHDRSHSPIEHYRYGSGSPTKYEVSDDKCHRPSSPNYGRPRKVEEFITKVQTEVSQPRTTGPLPGAYWRNSANPTGHTESHGYNDWNKPNGNYNHERLTEPTMVNSGGWSSSTPLGWTKPLTAPTNDINEAVHFLKEAVKSSSITTGAPNSRYAEPVSGFSKKDGNYTDTIDSSEAKRRYGRPAFKTSESYNGKISY